MIIIITKKWEQLDEVKFRGKARLIGEINENNVEYLLWQFYGKKDEIKPIFNDLIVKILEFKLKNGGE
jgi:hypothetical protein